MGRFSLLRNFRPAKPVTGIPQNKEHSVGWWGLQQARIRWCTWHF